MTLRAVAAVALAAAFAGCGPARAPYAVAADVESHLQVVVGEQLNGAGSRSVEVHLAGRVAPGGDATFTLRRLRHERVRREAGTSVVDTDSAAPDVQSWAPEDAAAAQAFARMTGAAVTARFDARRGLVAFEGLDAALRKGAAAGAGADDFVAGLSSLISDEALRRALRSAGLCEVSDLLDRADPPVEREAELTLPGAGVVVCTLHGRRGRDSDGSPVVRLDGRLRPGAVRAPAGAGAPPPEVGSARLGDVAISSETQHDRDTHRPLRGRVEAVVPYERGPLLTRRTSFTWIVGAP